MLEQKQKFDVKFVTDFCPNEQGFEANNMSMMHSMTNLMYKNMSGKVWLWQVSIKAANSQEKKPRHIYCSVCRKMASVVHVIFNVLSAKSVISKLAAERVSFAAVATMTPPYFCQCGKQKRQAMQSEAASNEVSEQRTFRRRCSIITIQGQ